MAVKGAQVRIGGPSDSLPRQSTRKDDSVLSISRSRAGVAQVQLSACIIHRKREVGKVYRLAPEMMKSNSVSLHIYPFFPSVFYSFKMYFYTVEIMYVSRSC